MAAGLALLLAAGAGAAGEREARLGTVLGRVDNALIEAGETLLDVAYQRRLGYQAVARLNPGVDPWIPQPGTVVRLPTHFILPDADAEGLVVNIPEMRLFDFTAEAGPEVFAVAIGDQADPSILGEFRVGRKRKDPTWHVPESIRQESPELPAQVPPGADNPLGSRWITIGRTSYGIHGTNVRWSIGREATHGCLRLYEDEVQRLYDRVSEGTRIQIVYQPFKWGQDGARIYLEVHPDLYGLRSDRLTAFELPRALGLLDAIDLELAWRTLDEARGVPVAVGTLPAPTSTPPS
ncbi:MAG: L,D-transpeptidase family protein [Myxococcota bacterium]